MVQENGLEHRSLWDSPFSTFHAMGRSVKIAWLFPGQGSQTVGMAKDAYDQFPAARQVFEQASQALGESLEQLCFEGPEERLKLTANTQPAMVTASLALLAVVRERIPTPLRPVVSAGHSLGEYSALVATGALRLQDAVSLVRLRGTAMQDAVVPGEGTMLAVMGLEPSVVEKICAEAAQGEVVSPANFNGTQIVIAGQTAAVARAAELAKQQKGKVIPLKVSAPFHCALMGPAARIVAHALETIEIGRMDFPVIANVDAQPNQESSRVKSLLVRQIDRPVRWEETVRWMAGAGITHALEIGPGKVLTGLVKRIEKGLVVYSCNGVAAIEQAATELKAAQQS
jgi:[acyl-carrier-protein] S-malonyltransferase